MKSIKEIAEEIAEGVTNQEYHNRKLADRIEKALRDRDDRAARIINSSRSEGADLRELVARVRDENYEVEP